MSVKFSGIGYSKIKAVQISACGPQFTVMRHVAVRVIPFFAAYVTDFLVFD